MNKKHESVGWLVKLAKFTLRRPRKTLIAMSAILIFGVISWTTLIPREGFPPASAPIVFIQMQAGGFTANGVDSEVASVVYDTLSQNPNLSDIETRSFDNGGLAIALIDETVDAEAEMNWVMENLEQAAFAENVILDITSFNPSKINGKYDMILAVSNATDILSELNTEAQNVASGLMEMEEVESVEVILQDAPLPGGGSVQTKFARFASNADGEIEGTQEALLIGVVANDGVDIDEISSAVHEYVDSYETTYGDSRVSVAADFAPFIDQLIGSLMNNLAGGLLAVTIVTFLFIAWRASMITALFIASVVITTVGILYLIGYTVNTISLFAIVLALGLFVDDATIVVEAAERESKRKNVGRVDFAAIKKVAMASLAGTLTTVLVFLPLAFVGGIIGSFIRVMPITISIALFVSLFISLLVTPIGLRKIFSKERKRGMVVRAVNGCIDWLADRLTAAYRALGAKKLSGKLIAFSAIAISFLMISMGGQKFGMLPFDIFPSPDDGDQLTVEVEFTRAMSVPDAVEEIEKIDEKMFAAASEHIVDILYIEGDIRSASGQISLTPYHARSVSALTIANSIEDAVENADVAAKIRVNVQAGGPPSEEYPFKMQIYSDDVALATKAAENIASFLTGQELTRPNGTTAKVMLARVEPGGSINRSDGRKFIQVEANFDATDVTTLVNEAQTVVEERFDAQAIEAFGLSADAFGFNFGIESQNQESFNSLLVVGPLAILAMYILLSIQFRSLIQPLLIFLAIPFSIFGVAYGLDITGNSISFFSMLGFLGLIGIAVNNTILLVDYANQERRAGANIVDAISMATRLRLRPLLATTITTASALLPLAISDPFWQPLAVVIIFGLLSSTFLVIVAFPYYYIAVYWLRQKLQRKRLARKA